MHKKIEKILSMIEDESLKKVVTLVMDEHHEAFITQPAGCSRHHAYKGGLLNHCYDTALVAASLADKYKKQYSPQLNRDLMIVGAFLHDLGKVLCYEKSDKGHYQSTAKSKLHHHIPIGFHLLANVTDQLVKIGDMDEDLADHLLHIIISHHGRVEYRSNQPPKTREAFLVAQADLIDAYMGAPEQARKSFNKERL